MKTVSIATFALVTFIAFACRGADSLDDTTNASGVLTNDASTRPSSSTDRERSSPRADDHATGPGSLRVGDARITLEFDSEPPAETRVEIERWVSECAESVASYYGRFPVARTTITMHMVDGEGVDHGVTRGFDAHGWIRVDVGTHTKRAYFAHDWVLTHEMVHLALPDLPSASLWLEEGTATYVEPLARARAGFESAEEVWKQLVEGLPQGQPKAGDRGLHGTKDWGRMYWGGAMFCLLADIDIRERTQGRFGLHNALAGIVASGLDLTSTADIGEVIAKGDAIVGVPVLTEMYARLALKSEKIDLNALWTKLGISMRRGVVHFDDNAPLASVRRAITQARH